MSFTGKFDKISTGVISGLLLPFLIALTMFLFSKGDPSLKDWIGKILTADIVSKIITLCVFPNVLIFLLFNHFDMLRASRGVLGITIAWAVIVFGNKLLI
ncbi:MAG TPA: hypothetical protein PKX27_03695 [Bacteroidales bacterium]|nr:hypothetical protein [Bacteroidales bacterium]HPM87062.1 hypothetical protein [Bacteroidales bacterium]